MTKTPVRRGVRAQTMAERAEQDAAEASLRAIAARQAAKAKDEPQAPDIVKVRVLKRGADKISTGQHAQGIGEVHYEYKDEFSIAREIADELEERSYVEIMDGEAKADD